MMIIVLLLKEFIYLNLFIIKQTLVKKSRKKTYLKLFNAAIENAVIQFS